MEDIDIRLLDRAAARDGRLVTALTGLVNGAYAVGEAGLWAGDVPRTSAGELSGRIGAGEIAVASAGAVPVGMVRVRDLDPETAELGMLAGALTHRGLGVGRALIDFAERLGRERGRRAMRLELLVPRTGTHPGKESLKAWYGRCGYSVVGSGPAERSHPGLSPLLAVPCDFLVYEKPLTGGRGAA